MSTTEQNEVNGAPYIDFPMQQGLTVGAVCAFLMQFPADQQVAWFLIAEDQTPFVGLHAADPGQPEYPAYPMIVTSFVPYDEVP